MKIDKDSMIKILNNRMECARRIRDEYHIGTTLYSFFDGERQECDELLSFLNTLKEDAEHYFPELKESEDEKIRKEILEFVDINTLSIDERHDRWIAWLEKQGEHAKFRSAVQVGDEVTKNEAGVLVNVSQLKRVVERDNQESAEKQKPTDPCDEAMYQSPDRAGDNITLEDLKQL